MAQEMEFCLLGPLAVRHDGIAVEIAAAKQRVLLAGLLLPAGRVVGVDELAELAWGAEPPASARVTVQNYIKRLRVALGDSDHSRIVTAPHGYRIKVAPGELDVTRFDHLLREARQAAQRGQWAEAAARLRSALQLWRGEPLGDVPSDLLALRERPRLIEMHAQAVEARIDADLHLGRHREVIAELRQLTAAHPLRERLHGMLMLALYRDGRQAEALAAYGQAHGILINELGVDPGPDLRDLYQRMLVSDPALMVTSPPRDSGHLASPGVPRQLPAALRHFAGRQAELKALSRLADEAAGKAGTVVISAIDGTAGIGKTALAVHFACQAADRFPDGQLYVNLRGFDPSGTPVTAAEAIRGFLDALQVPPEHIPAGLEAQAGLYRSLMAGNRMLIVLDNARDAGHVRPLLPASPGSLVLITSRSQLTALAAAEDAHLITLDVLTDAEAHEMLVLRLGPERVRRDAQATAELIQLCARLPLALAITAARAVAHPTFPLAAFAAELREAHNRLDALSAGDTVDVRAVFSWSYRRLGESAARMFRLLGLHPGPDITAAAAASLAAVALGQARQTLSELTCANMLTEHVPGRFALHDLLRAFAAEQAQATEDEADRRSAVHRALDHYLHTAYTAELLLNPQREQIIIDLPRPGVVPEKLGDYQQALAWFDAEHHVLLAVITGAAKAGFDAHAWQIPRALEDFFERRGHWHDYAATQNTALAAAQDLAHEPGIAHASRNLGHACTLLGSYDEAYAHLRRGLELFRTLDDRVGQARTHFGFAHVSWHHGRHKDAMGHAVRALELYRAAGHRAGEAHALNNVGYFHICLGDHQLAINHCRRALALHKELGNRNGEASAWDTLGYAHHHLREHAEAIACFVRSVAILRELGDRYNQADVLTHLGDAHHAAGDDTAARDAWHQAVAILDELHNPGADQIRANLRGVGATP